MDKKAVLIAALAIASCTGGGSEFWTVSDGRFVRGEDTLFFAGANMWYGPLLASDTEVADMDRLCTELDSLKSMGITNLRVLAGADGRDGVKSKVEPSLQKSPGVYDENVFVGLDRFLSEIGKRDMSAVIYLNNAWEWSGGFGQYLEWVGLGSPASTVDTPWSEYCAHTSKFVQCDSAMSMAADNVRRIVTRVNTVTGRPYSEDPAVFSWQICNEPRCFTSDPAVKEAFVTWLHNTAALIKSLDPNHMVSTGSEGSFGCEMDMELYRKIHSCPDVDYLTIHIWPLNWSWVRQDSLAEDLENAIIRTDGYIDAHIDAAREIGKPLVIEEFGFPRDGFRFSKDVPVSLRNAYYSHIIGRLLQSAADGGPLSGLNFWTWGGLARQDHVYWQKGDDYCGDPAQEQQGLNSVYMSDTSTTSLIRQANASLSKNRKHPR